MSTRDIYKSPEGREAVLAQYAELLERWPIPYDRHCVQTRVGETFVLACGPASAPPVLLLHGSGANAAMWMRDVALWAHAYRVYALDVIGEPGFSAPSRPPLTSDVYAQWLDDVMRGLGVARASFVGVSLGGWLVLDYAVRRADRVDKAVVISPGGVGFQRVSFLFKTLPLMLLGRWGRRRAMALALGHPPGHPHPMDRQVGLLAHVIAKHFRYRRGRVPVFSDDELKRLKMPVLAIVGDRDALLDSRATKRRLEQCAPRATVRMLPGVGHLVRDQAAEIHAFLSSERHLDANAAAR